MKAGLKLKVCGMRDVANINQLAALKPDYMGFIFYPKSKRFVSEMNEEVLKSIPENITRTGIFVDASETDILEKVRAFSLKAVQLHGSESPELCLKLRALGLEVIKAFGISAGFNFSSLLPYADVTDYFLFDTKTDEHGGSGKLFDWQLLAGYTLTKPYFLSGGIGLESLPDISSIEDSRLYALDLNSRFETAPALKDINKLSLFFDEIRIPVRNWRTL